MCIYCLIILIDLIISYLYRKNASFDAKNNASTASGSSVALSLAQESTSTNTITENTIPSPNSYSWSPALYQHTHGNYYKIKIIFI